jgi:hypothetical protein
MIEGFSDEDIKSILDWCKNHSVEANESADDYVALGKLEPEHEKTEDLLDDLKVIKKVFNIDVYKVRFKDFGDTRVSLKIQLFEKYLKDFEDLFETAFKIIESVGIENLTESLDLAQALITECGPRNFEIRIGCYSDNTETVVTITGE